MSMIALSTGGRAPHARAWCTVLALLATFPALALLPENVHKYTMSGTASLRSERVVQRNGALSLRAQLAPAGAALAAAPPLHEGGGYALMAKLVAQATVCYNDTIFRDDYDGDGG